MNADPARDHQNFRQAAPKRHPEARDTDFALSSEILTASRAGKEAIWALLRASPERLDPAKADWHW